MNQQPQQEQKKNSADILWQAAQGQIPPGMTQARYLAGIANLLKDKKNQLLQVGNTVFLLQNRGPGIVEFHTASMETPERLINNYKQAAVIMKKQGAKHVFTFAQEPGFERIARMTGLPVKVTQTQRMIGKKMVPAYRFDMDL